MHARRAVFLLAGLLVLVLPDIAGAQAVDRIVEATAVGTSSGAPSCVLDSSGNLHVVYSRNSATETRADLYYRMISFDQDWGVTIGAEVCLTAGYGSNTDSNPLDWTSLHMAPQAEIDSSGRIHVVFRGFGRLCEWDHEFYPYHTGIAYLNFRAPTDPGYTGVQDLHVARLVDNDFDAQLDPSQLEGAVEGQEWHIDQLFRRLHPTMSLREVPAENRVEIHVVFASSTGDDPSNGWDPTNDTVRDRVSYLRLVVNSSGVVAMDTQRQGFASPQAMRKHTVGEDRASTGYIPDWCWRPFALPSGHAMVVWGDMLQGQSQGYAVLVDPDNGVLDEEDLSATHFVYGFAAAVDDDAQVRVANMIGDEYVLWEEDPTGTPQIDHTTHAADYPDRQYFVGAAEVFADGMVQALIAPSAGGALRLARPDYTYLISPQTIQMPHGDLSTMGSGGPMYAVYAAGIDTTLVARNVVGTGPANNLNVTVFHWPDPDNDVVAWIAGPQDGAYIKNGRVTLSAYDGAPGDEESYIWREGSKVLGTGPSTVVSFKRGVHTIDLSVTRNGVTVTDNVTFHFGIEPPSPGITVSPTSGLQTTEGGGTASFTVVLDTEPTDSVTIDVASNDTSEGTVSPSQLVFDTSNWDTPQTVTVTGVDDSAVDGDVAYTILLDPASSDDGAYDELDPDDVAVTNQDDDGTKMYASDDVPVAIPDLDTVSSDLDVGESFTVATLQITLSITHPRPSDLTVKLISPDGTQGTVPGTSGTFTMTGFAGDAADGTWTLEITDGRKKKSGTLVSWSLRIGVGSG